MTDSLNIDKPCTEKEQELLNKYFGNLVEEAAYKNATELTL